MKKLFGVSLLVGLLCSVVEPCALTSFIPGKEQKIDWIQLTVEQKWGRATYNYDLAVIGGIAYAKSLGKTPEDFGRFVGELIAKKWEGTEGVAEFIRLMHRNWQVWDGFEMKVLSESEAVFKAKIKGVFAEAQAKEWTSPGVTSDECISFYEQIMKQITNHIGLSWEQKREGEWIVVSVTEKR